MLSSSSSYTNNVKLSNVSIKCHLFLNIMFFLEITILFRDHDKCRPSEMNQKWKAWCLKTFHLFYYHVFLRDYKHVYISWFKCSSWKNQQWSFQMCLKKFHLFWNIMFLVETTNVFKNHKKCFSTKNQLWIAFKGIFQNVHLFLNIMFS